MNDIYTVNDWMNRIADALEEGNSDMLNECIRKSIDWLQPEDERMAQMRLVEGVKELMVDNDYA
jgi:hypothetical protein